ncbi:MAG: LCP family protein, partial [Synechococcus sp.]|nr:LCP family protein [Synechococcus sp.]
PVRRHIVVKLDALPRLADLVGGVEVDVPKRLYYVDRTQGLTIDVQPGLQVLKGKDLEGFLRWRNDGHGDLGRLERQQMALKGLVERLKQPQNLVRLPQLIAAASSDLQTDLGPLQLMRLATALTTTDLNTERLEARPFQKGGISYLETTWHTR